MILPPPSESFAWTEHAGRAALVCAPLTAVAAHFWTTRQWPLDSGLLDPSRGDRWRAVADAAEVDRDRLIRVRQVHGISVALAERCIEPPSPAADILIARDTTVACAVQAADCVPLLLADRVTGAIAAVHCGWRGISLNAAAAAVTALTQESGSVPSNLVAALGPSIGACCYEVGLEVRQRFAAAGVGEDALNRWFLEEPVASARNPSMPVITRQGRRTNHWFFDGWRAVVEQLQSAGLADGQIFAAELCTASHPDVFCSYRRDGQGAGRLAGVIRPSMPSLAVLASGRRASSNQRPTC
jgi:YfiH family protein